MTSADRVEDQARVDREDSAGEVDLAVRWLGGGVVAASDESFGDKENLLLAEPAAFEPGHYGNRGEIVDGWETRRRRTPGHDWAVVRLGAPGVISSVDVDTSFFTGNFPESCRIEGCGREGYPSTDDLLGPGTEWHEIVPQSTLRGDTHNTFSVTDPHRYTHVRLSIFPDGGIARLRVLGRIIPDPRRLDGVTVDLAGCENGAAVVASSNGFYTSPSTLIRPDRPRTMGEGWETRRRRDDGHDFVMIRFGVRGQIRQLVVDTTHFKYNASASIAVYTTAGDPLPAVESPDWRPLMGRTPLQPDTRHVYSVEPTVDPATGLRLDAFPDGGIARVRAVGQVDVDGRRVTGYRWFNSLPASQVRDCLAGIAASTDVDAILDTRPMGPDWRERITHALLDAPDRLRVIDALASLLEGEHDRG